MNAKHEASRRTLAVMASIAIKGAYDRLAPEFERQAAIKIVTDWVPTVDILRRVGGGERPDIVIMAAAGIDDLITTGCLLAGSRTDIAKSGIGIGMRKGGSRVSMQSVEDLKRVLRTARSIGYSTGPSGVYLSGLFERLGIAEDVRDKLRVQHGGPVGDLIVRGEVEIGFQQIPELLAVTGVQLIGPLPHEIQHDTEFASGRHMLSKSAEGEALVRYLKTTIAGHVFRQAGMEPC